MNNIIVNKKINYYNILFLIFIFLFPILPQFIYILPGINIVNFTNVLFVLLFLMLKKRITIPKAPIKIFLFYFFYCLICLISVGIFKFFTYFISFIFIPFAFILFIDSKKKFNKVIDILILGGVCLGIFGLFESLFEKNILHYFILDKSTIFTEKRYGFLRIMTTFGQPIGYGCYQVFIVALINFKLITNKNKTKYIFAYFLCALNILLTVSRIPIFFFIFLQIIILFIETKKRNIPLLILTIMIVGIIFICFTNIFDISFFKDINSTFIQLFNNDYQNYSSTIGFGDRFNLWKWVIEDMKGHWFVGHGFDTTFSHTITSWFTKTSIENQYLNILYYCGLIGVLLMICSYIYILKLTKKNKKSKFNSIVYFTLILYYFFQLGVQESDLTRLYLIIIVLIITNNRVNKKQGEIKT